MNIDPELIETVGEEVNLDNLPINKPLHRVDIDNVALAQLASNFSDEGQWCLYRTHKFKLPAISRTPDVEVQFPIGRKGLFVGEDSHGRRELRIDTQKRSNWAFNGRHEGFVLYGGRNRFSIEDSLELPIPYSNTREYTRDAPFSPRGPTREITFDSLSIKAFSIGDFTSDETYDRQEAYAQTRRKCVPFKVNFPDHINEDTVKYALMAYQNILVDQGKLDQKQALPSGSWYHGVTLDSLASNNFDFEQSQVFEFPSYRERDEYEFLERQLRKHSRAALNQIKRAHAIRTVWYAVNENKTYESSGAGNGFNGITDYFSGRSTYPNKPRPINIQFMTNPNDPSEVWAKPIDIGGKMKVNAMYADLKENKNPNFRF